MLSLPRKVSSDTIQKIIISTVLASCMVNCYLNLAFYPSLLKYQGGSEIAFWLNNNNPQKYSVTQCEDNAWPMEFYLNKPLAYINPDTVKTIPTTTFLLYAPPNVIQTFTARHWHMQPIRDQQTYYITHLKPAFLNKATREKQLGVMKLVLVNPK